MMGLLPPLTDEEYRALKRLLAGMDEIEADYRAGTGRRGFEDAEAEPLRDFDNYLATLRAAVEGYEAVHGVDP